MRIGIVNSSTFLLYFPHLEERLRRRGEIERIWVDKNISGRELAERTKDCDCIVASVTPRYTEEFFHLHDRLKLISRHGAGYDNVDLSAATRQGVLVTRVSGEEEKDAVAELALTLILDSLRKTPFAYQAVREKRWMDRKDFVGRELRGKRVGVIGMGRIGSRMVEILRKGFDCEVLVYDPGAEEERIIDKGGIPVTLEELLSRSDIITLHASLTSENYHLLGEREFSLMKEGVVLVNTARGELLEEKALLKALEEGKVEMAGLDVVENEPPSPDHPFLREKKILLLPHIAAYTRETLERMDRKIVEDIEAVVEGRIPREVINPEVLSLPQLRIRKKRD